MSTEMIIILALFLVCGVLSRLAWKRYCVYMDEQIKGY